MLEELYPTIAVLAGLAITCFSIWTAGHALLRKRSPRSAAAWVGVCLLYPLLGASTYWVFGQNRIFTRARKLGDRFPDREQLDADMQASEALMSTLTEEPEQLRRLLQTARIGDASTGRPLLSGNAVDLLENAEGAYPRMLEAIDGADQSIEVCTYLFDGARTIELFVDALGRAVERGVRVRFLIDGLGDLFDWSRARRALAARGVEVARFLPPSISGRGLYFNLRNHRKILVVDGRVGFTGGMNLRDTHFIEDRAESAWRARDMHFEVRGPAVTELERVFLEDWTFTTGESFAEPQSRAEADVGGALVRAIPDGPNEDVDALKWVVVGAISNAHHEVRLMTPYFVPPEELEAALITAALRGMRVRLLLPGTVDHRVVHWASRAMLRDLILRGVEVRFQPAPFVHTKLLVIDEALSIVGSANMDPRSLRLNFELNLAVYDRALARSLGEGFDRDWVDSTPLTLEDLDGDPLWVRIRNNLARLAGPYL